MLPGIRPLWKAVKLLTPQAYSTYVCDIGPYKLCYITHISDILIEVCKLSSTEMVKHCLFKTIGIYKHLPFWIVYFFFFLSDIQKVSINLSYTTHHFLVGRVMLSLLFEDLEPVPECFNQNSRFERFYF